MICSANYLSLMKVSLFHTPPLGRALQLYMWGTLFITYACNWGPKPTYDFLNSTDYYLSFPEHYLKTDSVLQVVESYPKLNQQLDTLLFGTYVLKDHEVNLALVYALQANKLAIENNRMMARAVSSYYVALLKGRLDQKGEAIPDALVEAKAAQRLFGRLGEEDWIIQTDNLLGIFYFWSGRRDSAQYYLLRANNAIEEAALNSKEKVGLKAEILHDLGNFYSLAEDTTESQALGFYERSRSLYERSGNVPAQIRLLTSIGDYYLYNRSQYDSANSFYQEGLNQAQKNDDTGNILITYIRLGYTKYVEYLSQRGKNLTDRDRKKLGEAEVMYRKALQIGAKNEFLAYNYLAAIFRENYEEKFPNTSYLDSTIKYSKIGLVKARENGGFSAMDNAMDNLFYSCYERYRVTGVECDFPQGRIDKLLIDNYSSVVDTMIISLNSASTRYRKLELQESEEINRERITRNWMISAGGLLIAGLVFLLIAQRLRQKRLEARMDALRAQINPHFISNSLNAIENLINQDKKESAGKYLIHFSRFSRRILNGSREAIGTLHDELEMLKHFLALEQLRFKDKLNFSMEVEEGIYPKLVKVPNMILQPYVENAIWHGIKPKKDPGMLRIKVSKENKYLLCAIEDDGIGREKSRELQAASVIPRKSQGMAITEERLHVFAKKKANQVEIIDLYTQEGEARGTRVLVRIPYKAIKKEKNNESSTRHFS